MSNYDKSKRKIVKQFIEAQCRNSIEEKIDRYLEIEHQAIIGGHYFSAASTECIYLYRDGYFIGAVMMSHAINEGIIKFIAKRNNINRHNNNGDTKTIQGLINELREKGIISVDCAKASLEIWKSFRADIHHMNPKVLEIEFSKIAQKNLKSLSTIENEIFGFDIRKGAIYPHQPIYWDIEEDGTVSAFLRLE